MSPSKPKQGNAGQKNNRLIPPEDGVTVRMYRIGHGDCFLLAFAGETKDKPVYVLIDCGYKPGSPGYILPAREKGVAEIAKNIHAATGGHLDVAVITHEHQDHVNGITKSNFGKIEIGETWLAWTEDPKDKLANSLREAFGDTLLNLVGARNRLAAEGGSEQLRRIDQLLELELGMDSEAGSLPMGGELFAADGSLNKKSMNLFKVRAGNRVKYIRPHEKILTIPEAKDLRIFALGPPYVKNPNSVTSEEINKIIGRLKDMNPHEGEGFETASENNHAAAMSPRDYFLAAVNSGRLPSNLPFANQYRIPLDQAASKKTPSEFREFFVSHYGPPGKKKKGTPRITGTPDPSRDEVPNDAEWRRIDREWLYSAEQLALDMNSYTNNSSLVLAFELGKGGKVLLFAADAQRGNWLSWSEKKWKDGNSTVTTRDLLARTVLYKVGHHGSHNATLKGEAGSDHPGLGWMAQGDYQQEFTAMITAVRAWAVTQDGWDHPLKSIKEALLKKASGRVFQTDTDFAEMARNGGDPADWKSFKSRTSVDEDRLYFDYTITR